MLEKYIQWLDKIAVSLSKKGNVLPFIKKHKWKILIIFFLFKGLETMYVLYERGMCTNCKPPTEKQLEDFGGDIEKWTQYNSNFNFVPYTDFTTYFSDQLFPLFVNWIVLIVGMSIIYLTYKLGLNILKNIRSRVTDKIKNKMEEQLKKQKLKNQ